MKALLLSGGLDSSALAWWLRPEVCVTIDYGQRAAQGERAAAKALCEAMSLNHRLIQVDLSALGAGTMVNKAAARGASAPEFWPYRNQMLVTLAGMLLQPEGVTELIVGSVSTDRHADGRSPFFRALDRTMRLQEGGVGVSAPARKYSSIALLRQSAFPEGLIGLTFSCHVHEYACGQCGGCLKHREVVEAAYPVGSRQKRRAGKRSDAT
jgi:7-cyano-7-deazaguanine synthase